jgi:hypothetical protein
MCLFCEHGLAGERGVPSRHPVMGVSTGLPLDAYWQTQRVISPAQRLETTIRRIDVGQHHALPYWAQRRKHHQPNRPVSRPTMSPLRLLPQNLLIPDVLCCLRPYYSSLPFSSHVVSLLPRRAIERRQQTTLCPASRYAFHEVVCRCQRSVDKRHVY